MFNFANLSPILCTVLLKDSVVAMGQPRAACIVFTGEGSVKVKEFLRWMESWLATMREDFNGETPKSKTQRVAQLHLSYPARSVAGKFIKRLAEKTLWDEELLKKSLVDQFHDGEREDQEDEDVLTTMSTLSQGKHDVFRNGRKILKILQRTRVGLQHYDSIVIGYYLDGLTSQRLRGLAILSFCKRDSRETPFQVVKGVMRLATQLKIKGYRKGAANIVTMRMRMRMKMTTTTTTMTIILPVLPVSTPSRMRMVIIMLMASVR